MAGFNIERNKGVVSEIRDNIENKRQEYGDLEISKQKTLEAITQIEGFDLDEEVKKTVLDALNSALDTITERGEELAESLSGDIEMLETLREENDKSVEDNKKSMADLERKRELLSKVGLGGDLERAQYELTDNARELEMLRSSIADTDKALNELLIKARIL